MPAWITSLFLLLVSSPKVRFFSKTNAPLPCPAISLAIAKPTTPAPIIATSISAGIYQKLIASCLNYRTILLCHASKAISTPPRLLRGFAPRNDTLRLFLQDTIHQVRRTISFLVFFPVHQAFSLGRQVGKAFGIIDLSSD